MLQCRSSLIGTKRTSQQGFLMSAFGGKADIVRRRNHTFKISLRICEGSWRCQRTRSFGPRGGGRGLQGQNSAGSKQDEIGVRCCLQFNQSAFNHSICFDVARLQISRFRPEPNTFPLGPTFACEAAAVSVCHPAVNSRLPEPRKPPGTGALIFLRTAPSIAARRVPP